MPHDIKITSGIPSLDIQIKEQYTLDDFHGNQAIYDQYLQVLAMARRMDQRDAKFRTSAAATSKEPQLDEDGNLMNGDK